MSVGCRLRVVSCILLLAAACGPRTESIDLLPLLRQGAFIPRSDFADLRHGNRPLEEPLPEFWLTLPAVPGRGWGRALRGWRPVGALSTLEIRRRTGDPAELVFELHRRPAENGAATPIAVEALVDGVVVGGLELQNGTASGRFPAPAGRAGTAEVAFRFEPPIRQPASGPQEIALHSVGLLPAGAEPPQRGRSVGFDAAGRAVRIRHAGALVMPLRLPAEARRLRFELNAGVGSDETLLEAFALDPTGARIELGRARGAGPATVPLEAVAGDAVFLVLEHPGAGLTIRDPRLEVHARMGEPAAAATTTAGDRVHRPDVLLVVLDAARGDRFLPGPRRRELAPNLDGVAAEGIAFRRAWAECPTTSCSIPGLITGVSFLPVGDVWRGPPLADEATTLAEYLRAAGYRTVGYSATPNNSARLNSSQGFDRFEELWGEGNPHHGPYGLSELAVGAIREQPRDEPLYLQLHYLPPHEPYDPLPEFDRFTDPAYRGPVDPFMDLGPYKDGVGRLAAADLEQLVGLYDGNLLMADDAVGRVIEALAAAGRWQRTLLVMTSDHGEAFMEHGFWGHNSTLHEEMLHVPLIVRLPGGEAPVGVDPARPATLVDVVPTVLARLGLEPAAGVDGIDLLAPGDGGPRPLFHRTASLRWPQLAVRSGGWKLIAWPRLQSQALFDLEADPGEKENLAAERPLLYAGLGLLARQHLERTLLRRTAGEEVEPGAEAAEALRALGYVD